MDEKTETRKRVPFGVKVALALVAAFFLYKMGFQGIGILTAFAAVVALVAGGLSAFAASAREAHRNRRAEKAAASVS